MRLRAFVVILLFLCLFVRPTHAGFATITITPAVVPTPSDNDYTRIQNVLNGASAGDTIKLSGTFDFTEPNAAAAWAKGDDGVAGTSDDYEVLVPANVDGVTITADSLGDATIQGPGDLAAANLEGVLVFDRSTFPGTNQGWTISNLRILDFDLSIGMFASADFQFNNTTIQNNFIRIATDLNAVVAPADVNQNIGIYTSFGTNQSILNNTIEIPGDGVSSGSSLASTVGMQSDTGFDFSYDGLNISGNTIHVLHAQSANPESIIGIWENTHAHASNITVANNSFINDNPGNDPVLNLQKAFRVTSHSSATTTVTYDSNSVDGANIGFQWVAGANFAGKQPVVMTNNRITNSATGVLVQSKGLAHLVGNTITGSGAGGGVRVTDGGSLAGFGVDPRAVANTTISGGSADGIWLDPTASSSAPIALSDLSNNAGFAVHNQTASAITATQNWWGSNLFIVVSNATSGSVTSNPWLTSGTDLAPAMVGFQPFTWATSSGGSSHTTFAGSTGPDTGALLAGDPVTMTMNGETVLVPLTQLTGIDVTLLDSDDVFTLGPVGVPVAVDGGTGNDTLAGTNVAQTWSVTGAGSGSLSGGLLTFSNVEKLRGGTAADTFTFGAGGGLAIGVDGNAGTDVLDNTAIAGHTVTPVGAGSLDGFTGSASGATTFDNIDTISGTNADLAVNASGPSQVVAAATITYSIPVANAGPDAALDATLTDALPPGTTFASLTAPGGWSCTTPAVNAAGTVTCVKAVMSVGTETFALILNAPAAPGVVANVADVSSGTADSNLGNNSSPVTTTVIPQADVAVLVSGPPTTVAGTSSTFTITVTNNGPQAASSVLLSDALPPGATFASLTQDTGPVFGCTTPGIGSPGTITCSIASLPSGATASFSLAMNVSASAADGSTLSNTASITSTTSDPNTSNDSYTASTTINRSADLSITATAPSSVVVGSNIVYAVTVTNNGPSIAANVVVSDPTPAGLTFVSNSGACSTPYPCTLGTLTPGQSAVITTTMSTSLATGLNVSNTATVSSVTNDPSAIDNSATATTTVVQDADLAISMTGPSNGAPGTNLVYHITVTNNGPAAATAVSVADATPAGLTFVGNTGACATPYPCALGTIAAGASQVITTTMAIPAGFAGISTSNTATVSSATSDPSPLNNSATLATSIAQGADLAITMSGPATGVRGSNLAYVITVTNNGPAAATGVSVADATPAGLTFVGNSAGCVTAFPCALGTILPGSSSTISTTMAVPAGFAGASVSNTAMVSSATSDPSSINNSVAVTTTFGCQATLTGVPLPTAILGSAFSDTFGLTGGVAPVTFAISGALPAGLSLSGAVLSGTPAVRGSFPITLQASDSAGCSVSQPLTLAVSGGRLIAVGAGGGASHVRQFVGPSWAPATGLLGDFDAFAASFHGGVAVAQGDTNGDGVADVITGAGPGDAPLVSVFNGADGALQRSFLAYPASLTTGVEVASGDVNGDGYADIITAPGLGGPPLVRVFDGSTGALIREWMAMPSTWTGGLHVGAGDVNGDGFAEVITGAGPGGDPLVQVFDGATGALVRQFLPYVPQFAGGVYVAAGDVTGDGFADIVTGAGAGGGPHVRVFDGVTGDQIAGPLGSFYAYTPAFSGGVRVAAGDVNADGVADVITGAGPGGGPHVRVFDGASGDEMFGFFAFDGPFEAGTFVAGPPSLAAMVLDIPRVNDAVTGSVRVAGWAFEGSSVAAPGVEAVHVWAYPVAASTGSGQAGSPIFVGSTTAFFARPDVAAVFGGEHLMSGFDLSGPLAPGTYDLVVFVRNSVTHVFDIRRVVRVRVQ